MPDFTDLVRQRLAYARPLDLHPDVDTLTAYTERLLRASERERVVQHLAVCSDCREMVALTSQPVEAEVPILAAPAASRRLWRPWFGLAASFAAVAAIAVLIVELPRSHTPAPVPSYEQARSTTPAATPAIVASNNESLAATEPASSQPARAAEPIARTNRHEARERPLAAPAASRADNVVPSTAPVIESSRDASATVGAIAASAALPSKGPYINDRYQAGEFSNQTAVIGGTAVPLQSGFVANNLQVPPLSELPSPQTADKPIAAASPSSRGVGFLSNFRWEGKHIVVGPIITASGLVTKAMGGTGQFNPTQDSFQSTEIADAAAKKETSELGQTHSFTPRGMSPRAMGRVESHPPISWAALDGKLLRTNESGAWISAYSGGENIEFSVVTAHGDNIWAGGNHNALLHSGDGGANWERVRVADSTTGSIKSIYVSGASVQVTNSENLVWSSEDGGKSWTQN